MHPRRTFLCFSFTISIQLASNSELVFATFVSNSALGLNLRLFATKKPHPPFCVLPGVP